MMTCRNCGKPIERARQGHWTHSKSNTEPFGPRSFKCRVGVAEPNTQGGSTLDERDAANKSSESVSRVHYEHGVEDALRKVEDYFSSKECLWQGEQAAIYAREALK